VQYRGRAALQRRVKLASNISREAAQECSPQPALSEAEGVQAVVKEARDEGAAKNCFRRVYESRISGR
jgi:hypothetical protein